jgi:predicted transcriptional regulator
MKLIVKIDGKEQTIDLPEETVRELTAIAARNGISFAVALQQAIANENFLESQQASGAKLLIEKGDELREVVRETQPA